MKAIIYFLILSLASIQGVKAQTFTHPGILNTKSEFDFIQKKIKAGEQPWKNAFENLKKSKFASESYTPEPFPNVECGSYNKPNVGCNQQVEDAMAAYCNALMWVFTDEKKHADKAIEIINSWSKTYEKNTNSNARLVVSWATPWFVNAAEILKYSKSDWKTEDIAQFNSMLDKYLPYVLDDNMPGNNWVQSSIEANFAIAVFKDDKALFDKAVERWKYRVRTYIYQKLDGEKPVGNTFKADSDVDKVWKSKTSGTVYVDGLGMETCRDLGHLGLGFGSMMYAAETAWHQGVDLFTPEKKRLTDFMELHGSWMTGAVQVPDNICGGVVKAKEPDPEGIKVNVGGGQNAWEIAYNHLHDRLKIELPYSLKMIENKRPDDISRWVSKGETLTHAGRIFETDKSKKNK